MFDKVDTNAAHKIRAVCSQFATYDGKAIHPTLSGNKP